jgi:methyl-accepting chemotaxis protein
VGERIRAVGDSARQIGSITGTVKDLADQSNMLALNAAIEAVRSGEHGKGFAVVAREIRSLADQSIAATRRVSEILEALGASIQSAVTISDQGDRAVGDGLVRVQASGENMRACSESRSRTPKRRARSPPRSASRTRESSRSSSPSPISWR